VSLTVSPVNDADLSVTLDDGRTAVVPGTVDTYTIVVTNNGPDTVSSVILTDAMPAALLNPIFAPSVGAYDLATGAWSGLSLASGQSVSMTLSGTIDPNATGTLTNTVTVAPPAGTTDTNSPNNTASDTDTLTLPTADLQVTITDGTTTIVPGTIDTYTITVTNNGPDTVSTLTLIEAIPAGLSSPIFAPSVGAYDVGTGRGDVDASISLYALGIAKHLDELRTITTPLQLHYGLNDEHIPKSEVDAVIAAAEGNRNVEVYLYPGAEHGFFTKARPAFNAEAVAAATAHIERLLSRLT
jgi:uncharacterized repeat protein (TIGR01451 family)